MSRRLLKSASVAPRGAPLSASVSGTCAKILDDEEGKEVNGSGRELGLGRPGEGLIRFMLGEAPRCVNCSSHRRGGATQDVPANSPLKPPARGRSVAGLASAFARRGLARR